jgi:hypothetical protein
MDIFDDTKYMIENDVLDNAAERNKSKGPRRSTEKEKERERDSAAQQNKLHSDLAAVVDLNEPAFRSRFFELLDPDHAEFEKQIEEILHGCVLELPEMKCRCEKCGKEFTSDKCESCDKIRKERDEKIKARERNKKKDGPLKKVYSEIKSLDEAHARLAANVKKLKRNPNATFPSAFESLEVWMHFATMMYMQEEQWEAECAQWDKILENYDKDHAYWKYYSTEARLESRLRRVDRFNKEGSKIVFNEDDNKLKFCCFKKVLTPEDIERQQEEVRKKAETGKEEAKK